MAKILLSFYLFLSGFSNFAIHVNNVLHGFSYGVQAGNFAYSLEQEDTMLVTKRREAALQSLGMNTSDHLIVMATDHLDEIIDITDISVCEKSDTRPGMLIHCDCCFTTILGIPIMGAPADCTFSLLYAHTQDKKQLIGLLHAGRAGADLRLPQKAIKYMVEKYGCMADEIKIGVTPGISQKQYSLENLDKLRDPHAWGEYIEQKKDGLYYLDILGYIIQQYKESGITMSNIEAYTIDTYAEAKKGRMFSHRFAKEMKIPEGSTGVFIQLKSK